MQEDAAIHNQQFEPNRHLYGVFDGHGGGEVAKYSKAHFEDLLKDVEEFKNGGDTLNEGLRKGFLKVDESLNDGGIEEVAQTKRDNPPNKSPLLKILNDVTNKKKSADAIEAGEEPGEDDELALDSIGCTANVVMVDYETSKIHVANAGDSRCVMGRNGTCVPLSFDHKPESQTEIDRITAAGSVITDGRVDGHLNLTRALGDLKFKKKPNLTAEQHPITANPDTFTYELTPEDDFIMMGCDGCWESKSNEQMVEWIYEKLAEKTEKTTETLKSIVSDLLNELISPNHQQTQGVGCDNMTCILIVFKKK